MRSRLSINASDLARFLDTPEDLLQESLELQIAIATFPETPRQLLEILVNSSDPEIAEAAQLHINYAGELTENWQDAIDEKLKSRYLGQNDRLAVELLKIAPVPDYFLSEYVPPEYLIQGLSNRHLPLRDRLRLLERLAKEPTLEPRLQAAESPETPLPVLEQLIGDLELPIRLAVQHNPNCHPELVKLVEGQHEVASNWNTDTQQLENLGNSRWDWIRLAVAQNPSTLEETLLKLAGDKIFKIQLAVAKNPATSASVLSVLAEHLEQLMGSFVSAHPNATEEILHNLFTTQQRVIKGRQDLPASILERIFNESPKESEVPLFMLEHGAFIYFFLRQPNTPKWILAEFSNIDLDELRTYAGNNYKKSPIVQDIEGWIGDRSGGLVELTKHPQVSVKILEKLAECPDIKVQLAVAQNLKTSEELRLQLLEELAIHSDYKIKAEVAKDLNTPVSILEKMAQNEFYQPKLRQEIRRVLASEYPENAREYKTTADSSMSNLKHKILYPANISINVDRWMETIENSEIWEIMTDDVTSTGTLWSLMPSTSRLITKVTPQWSELLSELPEDSLKRVVTSIHNILGMIKGFVKDHQFMRSVAVVLVENPNTPINLREKLKNELIRPNVGISGYQSDCDVITALAYNTAIPETERMNYFQQLLSVGNNEYIAQNSQTPNFILEQLAENNKSKYTVAENPNASGDLLRQLALEDNPELLRRIASNTSAPTDLLISLANRPVEQTINNVKPIRERVLNNPSLPNLKRYRLLIEKEEEKENEKANQILAKRTDSPYALARVLETGDRNVKISAARNNKTPIQLLEQLAKDEDETVRKVVAQNHNLPLSSLLELAEDSSVGVRLWLANKTSNSKIQIPLQLLEKLAKDKSEQVRARIAKHPDAPVELLVQLANDSSIEVKKKLTGNLNTPVTVLNCLGLEENLVNQRNPNTPGEVLATLVNSILREHHQNDPRWKNLESTNKRLVEIIKYPVKGSQMPANILDRLASHHYPSVRMEVAAHPNTMVSTLEKLVNDSYVPTLRLLAQNPNTPPDVLEKLANNPDLTTRLSIVRHPNTPARVLAQIVEDAQRSGNEPNRTKDTLKSAIFGDAYDLLKAIAANPRTPVDALEILARREFISPTRDPKSILPPKTDDDVMRSLAYNPSLTPELINILTQDPCVDVRIALTRHPNLTEALWMRLTEDTEISLRKAIASKTNAPITILETLAQDSATDVRTEVAGNNHTTNQILEQLSQDEEAAVRTKVAANSNTPNNVLEKLAQDESVEVRRAVAQNPNISESIRDSLRDLLPAAKTNTQSTSPTLRGLSRIYNPNTDDLATVLSEYVESDVAFVRFVSLLHPLIPVEILENGANSISWIERYAVANNPATPTEIKQQLTQDSNQIVRAVAIANK